MTIWVKIGTSNPSICTISNGCIVSAFSEIALDGYLPASWAWDIDRLYDPFYDIVYAHTSSELGTITMQQKANYDELVAAEQAGFKPEYLSKLTVTTTNGNTFLANNDGQNMLLRDIMSLEFSSGTEKQVVLHDGAIATISLAELKEALVLAVEATTSILVS